MRLIRDSFLPITLIAAAGASAAQAQQFTDQTASQFPPAVNQYSNQVAIADIDADSDLDIVFASGGNFGSPGPPQPITVYINDGGGSFTNQTSTHTAGITAIARDVEFGDVDGDGDLDMAVAQDFARQPLLLINDGAGVFTDQTASLMPAINLGSPHCAFGDVDNDGDLDLVFANGGSSRFGTGPTQLFINDGAGVFSNETSTRLPNAPVGAPMDILLGDVDGDLDLDILVASRSNSTRLFINDGAGVFSNATSTNWPGDGTTYSFDFGDFDNDGDLDVLGVNSLTPREGMYVNNGAGVFTNMSATLLPGPNNPNIDDNDSKFFDIDDDGDLDFIIASLGSAERISVNNGSTFTLTGGLITPVADSSLDVEVGDLDGDGDFDIVTSQGESGSFKNRLYINSGPADTHAPTIVDFDQLANTSDTVGPYPVRAIIRDGMTSDHGFFPTQLKVVVTVNGGPPFDNVPLLWSGHDLFRAEVPGQAAGSTVTYKIKATDFAGNTATSATASFIVGPPGDLNGDGLVNGSDLAALLAQWGTAGPADINGDGVVNGADLAALLANWTG